jgi:hypothetical protein
LKNNLAGLGFATLYLVLAAQAEPVTAALGYIAGGILLLATLARWNKSA